MGCNCNKGAGQDTDRYEVYDNQGRLVATTVGEFAARVEVTKNGGGTFKKKA